MKNKLLFSVFVYFIILVLLSLGSWQLYRLNWKLGLISEIENSLKINPDKLSKSNNKNYLRIKTSGTVDFDKQVYLYNLNDSGKPGFEVINPILIGNENYLINRGWIPFDKKNKAEINTLDRNDVFKYTSKNFSPFIIYLNNNLELPKPKIITVNISNSHKKYAITWFSLAFSIFFFYLYVRKNKY